MTKEELFEKQMNDEKYFTMEDMRVNRKYGFLLSKKGLDEYLLYKENKNNINKSEPTLLSWNSSKG